MFLTYVIKFDKREVLRLYFEHIYVLLLFLAFPGNCPYAVKRIILGHMHYLIP